MLGQANDIFRVQDKKTVKSIVGDIQLRKLFESFHMYSEQHFKDGM